MSGLTSFLTWVGGRRPRFEPVGRRLLIAFLSGLMIASGAYSLYQVLDEDRGGHLRRMVDSEAERTRTEFAEPLERNARLVEEFARKSVSSSSSGWESQADEFLAANPQLRAIAWFDTLQVPRAIVPNTARLLGFDLDPRDDTERARNLRELAERTGSSYSASVVLADGRRQILMDVPVRRGDRVVGHVVGVMRLRDLIDELSRPALMRSFAVAVYEGPFLLFGPVWQEGGPEASWETDAALQTNGLFWVVQVWPSGELLREVDPKLPEWVLGFGLALALIVAIGVYRLLVWKDRARAAERRFEAANASDAASGVEVVRESQLETSAGVEAVPESGSQGA